MCLSPKVCAALIADNLKDESYHNPSIFSHTTTEYSCPAGTAIDFEHGREFLPIPLSVDKIWLSSYEYLNNAYWSVKLSDTASGPSPSPTAEVECVLLPFFHIIFLFVI
jgi:hypothetical protein